MSYTYEQVSAKLAKLAGPFPTPDDVFNAANQLSPAEIAVLVAHADKNPPMTKDQEARFIIGTAETFSSPSSLKHIQTSASDAATAVDIIEKTFINLERDLASIDKKYPGSAQFTPELRRIHQKANEAISSSETLALDIANYAQSFDELIIPLATDNDLTIEARRATIQDYIDSAKAHETKAIAMQNGFETVRNDFSNFTLKFEDWGEERMKQAGEEIKQLNADLNDLRIKLGKMQAALVAVGAIAVGTLPATGIIAALSGPLAPFVMIGGLLIAGTAVATTIGLAFGIAKAKREIREKEAQVLKLEQELDTINETRTNLQVLRKGALDEVDTNIGVLNSTWKTVQYEAYLIIDWLKKGAKDADKPKYMMISINNAVITYTQMATYLRKYAFGVQVAQLKSEAYAKEVRANKTHQNGLNQHVHKCSCGEVFDVSTQAPQTSLKA